MKKFLVSVANARAYDSNDNLLFVGKTLLDTSIETTLGNTDVRAGIGNQLQYVYYHTAEMNVTITEAQFSLEFLALNAGTTPQMVSDMFVEETVSVSNGQGNVTKGTPLALSTATIYGWVTEPDGTIVRATFSGSTFSMETTYTGDACIRYYTTVTSARNITIYADMLPSTVRLVLDTQLCSSDSTTNQIGTVEIQIPRASMTGQFTLSLAPDSVASTPLSIRALSYTPTSTQGGCTGNRPYYAKIVENITNTNWYDAVVGLSIEGGDITLAQSTTKILQVYAITNSGSSFLVPNSELTFSTTDTTHITIGANTGLLTSLTTATTTAVPVSVTITAKTSIDASVFVTVS